MIVARGQIYKLFDLNFGFPGRLLETSKSNADIIHNGNIVIEDYGKIWYGDIHKINDQEKLQKLADKLNKKIFVLREMDGRFENENNPLIDKAVLTFIPKEK